MYRSVCIDIFLNSLLREYALFVFAHVLDIRLSEKYLVYNLSLLSEMISCFQRLDIVIVVA